MPEEKIEQPTPESPPSDPKKPAQPRSPETSTDVHGDPEPPV